MSVVFDAATLELLRSGCALLLATVDGTGEPRASRGWGLATVEGHDRRLRLVVDREDAALADHFGPGRAIAVTATDVATLQSRQLKGTIVAVEPATATDLDVAGRYCEDFFGGIHALDRTSVDLLERLVPPAFAACTFEVDDMFDQAPGPNAGGAIEPSGAQEAR